jgi:hypothetical protein
MAERKLQQDGKLIVVTRRTLEWTGFRGHKLRLAYLAGFPYDYQRTVSLRLTQLSHQVWLQHVFVIERDILRSMLYKHGIDDHRCYLTALLSSPQQTIIPHLA